MIVADDGTSEQDDGAAHGGRLEGVSRRQFLAGAGGTVAAVGGGRAIYNTMLGYGHFGLGTNLLEQDLAPLFDEHLVASYDESFDDVRVWLDDDGVGVETDGSNRILGFEATDGEREARRLDDELGLEGRIEGILEDGDALRADEYTFEFHEPAAFFERLEDATFRPDAVAAIRGRFDRAVDPDIVETFAGTDPADPEAVIYGLKEGFREHASYDVPRYAAGSVEDNVIFGAYDLRQHFTSPVDFESLLAADSTGMFCWEFVYRSMEALQALAPWGQTVPVAACYVSDRRHKHAYTGVVSAIEDDGLRLPTTFVDYTYSTLYDDLRLTWLLGEGLEAYDSRHRADTIYWSR